MLTLTSHPTAAEVAAWNRHARLRLLGENRCIAAHIRATAIAAGPRMDYEGARRLLAECMNDDPFDGGCPADTGGEWPVRMQEWRGEE